MHYIYIYVRGLQEISLQETIMISHSLLGYVNPDFTKAITCVNTEIKHLKVSDNIYPRSVEVTIYIYIDLWCFILIA